MFRRTRRTTKRSLRHWICCAEPRPIRPFRPIQRWCICRNDLVYKLDSLALVAAQHLYWTVRTGQRAASATQPPHETLQSSNLVPSKRAQTLDEEFGVDGAVAIVRRTSGPYIGSRIAVTTIEFTVGCTLESCRTFEFRHTTHFLRRKISPPFAFRCGCC